MSRRGGKPTSTSPGSWPRPVSVRKRLTTLTRSSPQPRSRCARLKKAPPDRAAPGGPGDHGDDPVLLAAGTDRQGTRLRRRWALPGIGGLPVQRGLQSQRAGGGRPSGRSVADRTGSGGVSSSRSGIGRESHWADRGRVGGPDAGHAHPGSATVPARRTPGRQRVRGQEYRGRDRRWPGPCAHRGRDGESQRQTETEEIPDRVARAQGRDPL